VSPKTRSLILSGFYPGRASLIGTWIEARDRAAGLSPVKKTGDIKATTHYVGAGPLNWFHGGINRATLSGIMAEINKEKRLLSCLASGMFSSK